MKKKWTRDEDKKLLGLVENYKESHVKWKEVGTDLGKGMYQCYTRYKKLTNKENIWNSHDIKRLNELISVFGTKWKSIAKALKKFTPEEIRRQYFEILGKNSKFTPEEDLKLIELFNSNGQNWELIAASLEKSVEAIKTRLWFLSSKSRPKKLQNTTTLPMIKNSDEVMVSLSSSGLGIGSSIGTNSKHNSEDSQYSKHPSIDSAGINQLEANNKSLFNEVKMKSAYSNSNNSKNSIKEVIEEKKEIVSVVSDKESYTIFESERELGAAGASYEMDSDAYIYEKYNKKKSRVGAQVPNLAPKNQVQQSQAATLQQYNFGQHSSYSQQSYLGQQPQQGQQGFNQAQQFPSNQNSFNLINLNQAHSQSQPQKQERLFTNSFQKHQDNSNFNESFDNLRITEQNNNYNCDYLLRNLLVQTTCSPDRKSRRSASFCSSKDSDDGNHSAYYSNR